MSQLGSIHQLFICKREENAMFPGVNVLLAFVLMQVFVMVNYIITVQPDSRQLCPPLYFRSARRVSSSSIPPRWAQSAAGPLVAFHSDKFFNFRPSALYQPSVQLFQYPGEVWIREGNVKINYENINSGVIIISLHFSSVWQVFIFPTDNWSSFI